jgi:hypothetical protein
MQRALPDECPQELRDRIQQVQGLADELAAEWAPDDRKLFQDWVWPLVAYLACLENGDEVRGCLEGLVRSHLIFKTIAGVTLWPNLHDWSEELPLKKLEVVPQYATWASMFYRGFPRVPMIKTRPMNPKEAN